MKKALSVALALIMIMSTSVFSFAQDDELRFGADGKFKILQISDPQDDQNPAYDLVNFIKLAIDETNPDLVIFTGDIVEDSRVGDVGIDDESGREGVEVDGDYDKTLSNVKTACEAVFSYAESKGIPFANCQGNNDYSSGIKNEHWLEIYKSYDNCIVEDESDDADGKIDFNIEIKSSDGSKTAFNIWMIDSGRNGVSDEQLAWYKAESNALAEANGGKPVPAFWFQHVQTDDIGNLFEECNFWDEGAVISDGKCYRLNQNIASGYNTGAIKPGTTTDEFKAWKECGDVRGAYFGHWHTEGYTGIYDGIELGFTYGCEFAKPGPYGIRVFTLDENDIENYENELYTYEGSVSTNDARFVLQVDKPYAEYDNIIDEIIAGIKNTFALLKKEIISLFA